MFFMAIVTKGRNRCDFLFASTDDEALSEWDGLCKERIYS